MLANPFSRRLLIAMLAIQRPVAYKTSDSGQIQRLHSKRRNKMKLIKMFGLAVMAALMAMALAGGASSAMAEPTALCNEESASACMGGHLVTHVHESTLSGAKAKLLTGLITVSCDVLFLGDTVAKTSTPLVIEGSFTYTSCGSCTVEELEGGEAILEILKEGHETAKVTGEAVVFVDCGGSALECEYDLENLSATAKGPFLSTETNGEVKIAGQVMHKHPGGEGAFCPKETKLDITTTPLSATYITGPGPAVLHDWICRQANPLGSGVYDTNSCLTRPLALMEWYRQETSSTPINVKSVNTTEFELETSIGGESTLINCTTESGTGSAWNPNPIETKAGEGKTTMTLEGCTVSKPSGCAIPGKKIVTNELHEVLEEDKTLGPGSKFTPASGEIIAEITLEKCSKGELNKKYTVKGSAFGIANEHLVEFTNASSSLTFGGSEAKLRGKIKQEDEGGNLEMILP
jgi:hypothetical protein